MTGLTNYSADNLLNYATGQIAMPALPSVFLALFTAAGTDAGTGFTEVSGGAYARVQIAGALAAGASFTTATASITMGASIPAWVVAGMTVYDATNQQAIGTVSSTAGTTLTLTSNAAHASSGAADTLNFSAFGNASGTAPSSLTNGGVITFPAATASWGTVVAWGLYDASTSGNLLWWDYLGNFNWTPCTISSASPAVITSKAHGISAGGFFVFSTEYGGTAPTFSSGNLTGILTASATGLGTDTLENNATTNTSSTGDGMIRQVTQQSIPVNVTASFATSSFTLVSA